MMKSSLLCSVQVEVEDNYSHDEHHMQGWFPVECEAHGTIAYFTNEAEAQRYSDYRNSLLDNE